MSFYGNPWVDQRYSAIVNSLRHKVLLVKLITSLMIDNDFEIGLGEPYLKIFTTLILDCLQSAQGASITQDGSIE